MKYSFVSFLILCAMLLLIRTESRCPSGQYCLSSQICFPITKNCESCQIFIAGCNQCEQFYQKNNLYRCISCLDQTSNCFQSNMCLDPTFYYDNYINEYNQTEHYCLACSSVDINCVQCQMQDQFYVCLLCQTNIQVYLSPISGLCEQCSSAIPNCAQCQQNNSTFIYTCTKCLPSFCLDSLDSLTCLSETNQTRNCQVCKVQNSTLNSLICLKCEGQYGLNATKECVLCGTHCYSCDLSLIQECTLCYVGYYYNLTNASSIDCFSCRSYNFGCLQCNYDLLIDQMQCSQCLKPYYYANTPNTCVGCSHLIPFCLKCQVSPKKCIQCYLNAYMANDTVCVQCPIECGSCQSSTQCKTCTFGRYYHYNSVSELSQWQSQLFNSSCWQICGDQLTFQLACDYSGGIKFKSSEDGCSKDCSVMQGYICEVYPIDVKALLSNNNSTTSNFSWSDSQFYLSSQTISNLLLNSNKNVVYHKSICSYNESIQINWIKTVPSVNQIKVTLQFSPFLNAIKAHAVLQLLQISLISNGQISGSAILSKAELNSVHQIQLTIKYLNSNVYRQNILVQLKSLFESSADLRFKYTKDANKTLTLNQLLNGMNPIYHEQQQIIYGQVLSYLASTISIITFVLTMLAIFTKTLALLQISITYQFVYLSVMFYDYQLTLAYRTLFKLKYSLGLLLSNQSPYTIFPQEKEWPAQLLFSQTSTLNFTRNFNILVLLYLVPLIISRVLVYILKIQRIRSKVSLNKQIENLKNFLFNEVLLYVTIFNLSFLVFNLFLQCRNQKAIHQQYDLTSLFLITFCLLVTAHTLKSYIIKNNQDYPVFQFGVNLDYKKNHKVYIISIINIAISIFLLAFCKWYPIAPILLQISFVFLILYYKIFANLQKRLRICFNSFIMILAVIQYINYNFRSSQSSNQISQNQISSVFPLIILFSLFSGTVWAVISTIRQLKQRKLTSNKIKQDFIKQFNAQNKHYKNSRVQEQKRIKANQQVHSQLKKMYNSNIQDQNNYMIGQYSQSSIKIQQGSVYKNNDSFQKSKIISDIGDSVKYISTRQKKKNIQDSSQSKIKIPLIRQQSLKNAIKRIQLKFKQAKEQIQQSNKNQVPVQSDQNEFNKDTRNIPQSLLDDVQIDKIKYNINESSNFQCTNIKQLRNNPNVFDESLLFQDLNRINFTSQGTIMQNPNLENTQKHLEDDQQNKVSNLKDDQIQILQYLKRIIISQLQSPLSEQEFQKQKADIQKMSLQQFQQNYRTQINIILNSFQQKTVKPLASKYYQKKNKGRGKGQISNNSKSLYQPFKGSKMLQKSLQQRYQQL